MGPSEREAGGRPGPRIKRWCGSARVCSRAACPRRVGSGWRPGRGRGTGVHGGGNVHGVAVPRVAKVPEQPPVFERGRPAAPRLVPSRPPPPPRDGPRGGNRPAPGLPGDQGGVFTADLAAGGSFAVIRHVRDRRMDRVGTALPLPGAIGTPWVGVGGQDAALASRDVAGAPVTWCDPRRATRATAAARLHGQDSTGRPTGSGFQANSRCTGPSPGNRGRASTGGCVAC